MIRKDLINEIASKFNLPKEVVDSIIDTLTHSIVESLRNGEDVILRQFGKFSVVERKSKIGHNFQTGESFEVPAKRLPVFKFSKSVKEKFLK